MRTFQKSTPDGTFTVTIDAEMGDDDDQIPEAALEQLVQLLDEAAQLFRVPKSPPKS